MSVTINGSTSTISGLGTGGIADAKAVAAAACPGGSIIQVTSTTTDAQNTAYTSWVNSVSGTITPKYSTSKILIFVSGAFGHTQDTYGGTQILRYLNGTYTAISTSSQASGGASSTQWFLPINRRDGDAQWEAYNCSGYTVDSPSTTLAMTYYFQFRKLYGNYLTSNRPTATNNATYHWNSVSNITLMELHV